MTRAEIEQEYKVEDGRITSPGKFEGEPIYAPYFWDLYLNGFADDDDGELLTFAVDQEAIDEFPELQNIATVQLWENSQGFVSTIIHAR